MNYRVLSAVEMKKCDLYASERAGCSSLRLMERAAGAAFDEIKKQGYDLSRVYVVCGGGNNGGDGFALAKMLSEEKGAFVSAVFVGDDERMTEECAFFRSEAEKSITVMRDTDLGGATLIIDALFGIGLSREISGRYADMINKMNGVECAKVALDIPSGINADTGEVIGAAFKADLTIAFAYLKRGNILDVGQCRCGESVVCDIGISADAIGDAPEVFTSLGSRPFPPPTRRADSNKGDYGKVLVIGGAAGMSGAVYFSALAAYRSGAGLVRIFTSRASQAALSILLPEAVTIAHDEDDDAEISKKLPAALSDATSVVLGPGLSQSENAKSILKTVISECRVPLILDADALNIIGGDLSLFKEAKCEIVITPHMGEMSRLTSKSISDLKRNRISEALEFSALHGVVCVLKDARTVVADAHAGRCYLNTSGCSAMSKGGSGDALTGVIAALIAAGMPVFEAASLGVYLHGEAGERAADIYGEYSVLARDIAGLVRP